MDIIEQSFYHVEEHYNSKNRFYHNLDHLDEMCAIIISYFEKVDFKTDIDTNDLKIILILATHFHDVIYDTNQSDEINVKASVEFFTDYAIKNNIDPKVISIVQKLILATIDHDVIDSDLLILTQFFLDIDLYILGSHNSDYQKYSKSIRQEYNQFTDDEYKIGRINVLTKLYKKAFNNELFKSDIFKNRNIQARLNIADEIISLS